ncbi:MAG: DUF6154 family protein [Tumebacillaceae bacterium]
MKLADDLFHLYKNQLVGDEEDAMILAAGTLEGMEREHYLDLVAQLSDGELFEMFGHYLVYKLRLKMATEGLGTHDGGFDPEQRLH